MKKRSFILVTFLILLVGCRTNNLTNIKVSDAYDPAADFSKFRFFAFHESDSVTRIFYQINTGKLLYAKELGQNQYKAQVKFSISIFNAENPKELYDSLSFILEDTSGYQLKLMLTDSLDLGLSFPGKYYVQFELTDLNRKSSTLNGAYIYKSSLFSRQNYMLRDEHGAPVFETYLQDGSQYVLHSNNTLIPRMFVHHYPGEYPIALAPFVEIKSKKTEFIPDSVFFIDLDGGISAPLDFPMQGIYHISVDSGSIEGYSLFRFHPDFPVIASAEQMRFPIRYISTKNEFNDMMMLMSAKEGVDEFWLKRADNPERAKELIRKYYGRVMQANAYFTSYQEGWKTDRGMIYIIFGPPTLVYRNPGSETWIYGEDRNILSITLVFRKNEHIFTDNDYILDRSQEYKEVWYNAVDAWRN